MSELPPHPRRPGQRWEVLLAIALTALAFNAIQAQNLVSNPGFESGTNHWFSLSTPFTLSAGGYSGTACALVSLPSGFAPGIGQSLPSTLQSGQSYTWSAWLRISPAIPPPPRSVWLDLHYTSSGTNYVMPVTIATLSTTWTQVSASFDWMAAGPVSNVFISFEGASATTGFSFYLDEVSIVNSSPLLSIARTDDSVTLSWPASAGAHSLQSKANLVIPVAWTSVTNQVQTNGNTHSVTLSPANASRLYRLRK